MSKKKDLIQEMVKEAQNDFVRREDTTGQEHEASLQSITEAARLATGARLAQFNVLDQETQTTIVTAGRGSRRGATLNIENTFCQHVVRREDDDVTMINAHPALGVGLGQGRDHRHAAACRARASGAPCQAEGTRRGGEAAHRSRGGRADRSAIH